MQGLEVLFQHCTKFLKPSDLWLTGIEHASSLVSKRSARILLNYQDRREDDSGLWNCKPHFAHLICTYPDEDRLVPLLLGY